MLAYFLGIRRYKKDEKAHQNNTLLANIQRADKARNSLADNNTINTAANDFCYLYRPVYADYENDTPETIQQIDQNNIAYEELCKI